LDRVGEFSSVCASRHVIIVCLGLNKMGAILLRANEIKSVVVNVREKFVCVCVANHSVSTKIPSTTKPHTRDRQTLSTVHQQ